MTAAETRTKIDCASEDRQEFTRPMDPIGIGIEKGQLEKLRLTWKENIVIQRKEIEPGNMDWIHLAPNRVLWCKFICIQ
jgi:hypothetical protein